MMKNLKNHLITTTKSLLLCATFIALGTVQAKTLQLSLNGKTQYVIVTGNNAIPVEKHAAKELSLYLQKITGAKFNIITEKDATNAKFAIYVGGTKFAAQQGIKQESLDSEEWLIKNVNKKIIITGGRPRGTLYGTYEYLEHLGCLWLDEKVEYIPKKQDIEIKNLYLRNKPAIQLRMVYTGKKDTKKLQLQNARSKDTRAFIPEFGFSSEAPGHTFYSYSKQFPKDHPEYHAMNRNGQRIPATSPSGPGQICLSNPEVRKLMVKLLEKNIVENRKKTAKQIQLGAKERKIFYVTPNDNAFNCQCKPCKEFMEKEGTDSALYVDFINSIADGIKTKYPDVLIGFFAYENNLMPPKRIVPRDNTIVCFAQLNAEWKKIDTFPDLYRPMTHPINKKAKEVLEQWAKIAKHVEIWDYFVQFVKNKFPTPNTTLFSIVEDIKWFQNNNVSRVFAECEFSRYLSFFELTCWVSRKMLQNPNQDYHMLIKKFMKGYYGPAAPKMTEYLYFLQKSIESTPLKEGKICAQQVSERSYLNLQFYKTVSKMLDEAEKSCPAGSIYLANVKRERLLVDAGIYCMWQKLEKQLSKGQKMPWKAAEILKRYKNNRIAELKAYPAILGTAENATVKKYVDSEITKLKGFHSAGKGGKPLVITIPREKATISGNPSTAAWNKAIKINQWFSAEGNTIPERKISGKIIMDSKYLYLLLEEKNLDLAKLNPQWWAGDAWELFFSNNRSGVPYKQLAINSDGKQNAFAYTDNMANLSIWKAKIIVKTEKKNNCWKTFISIPLSGIMTQKEIDNGNPIFMNIFRSSKHLTGKVMCISPIFDANYHDMNNLVEIIPQVSWPTAQNNLVFKKSYTLSKKPNWKLCVGKNQSLEKTKLTDGIFHRGKTPMWFNNKTTTGFTHHGNIEITFDLGKTASIEKVFVNCGFGTSGVELPSFIEVKTSMDNKTYSSSGKITKNKLGNIGYRAESLMIPVNKTNARFIKIVLNVTHWYLCLDEIAIQGQWK